MVDGFVDDVKDDVVVNERSLNDVVGDDEDVKVVVDSSEVDDSNDVVVAVEDVGVVSVSSLCVKVPEASCIRRTSSLVQDGCGRSRFDGKFHILVDSGAMIHVCPERFVDRRVLSSVGSCPLRIAGASGAKIAHHGYRGVSFCCGASVFSTVFAVADVKEAILSSLVMARHGWRTILDETSGCLVHRASRSRIPLVRERKGWYVVVDDAQAFWSTIAASKVLDEHQVLRSQLNPVVEENDEEDDDVLPPPGEGGGAAGGEGDDVVVEEPRRRRRLNVKTPDPDWRPPDGSFRSRFPVDDKSSSPVSPFPSSGSTDPKEVVAPVTPTDSVKRTHALTHYPFASWCPHCVAGQPGELPHRRLPVSSAVKTTMDARPVVQIDYWFAASRHAPSATYSILTCVDIASSYTNSIVIAKGNNLGAVNFLKNFIVNLGYSKVLIQSDAESAAVSLAKTVASQLTSCLTRIAPVGSHGSQGSVERKIQSIQVLMRVFLSDLESRLSIKITVTSPLFQWLLRHVCFVLNKYSNNHDELSPHESVYGAPYVSPLCCFGETIQFLVPAARQGSGIVRNAKLSMRWQSGVWLGRSHADNSHLVLSFALSGHGSGVLKIRSVRRVVEKDRWSLSSSLVHMLATPLNPGLVPVSYKLPHTSPSKYAGSVDNNAVLPTETVDTSNTSRSAAASSSALDSVPQGMSSSSGGGRAPRFRDGDKTEGCNGCLLGSGYHHTSVCNDRFRNLRVVPPTILIPVAASSTSSSSASAAVPAAAAAAASSSSSSSLLSSAAAVPAAAVASSSSSSSSSSHVVTGPAAVRHRYSTKRPPTVPVDDLEAGNRHVVDNNGRVVVPPVVVPPSQSTSSSSSSSSSSVQPTAMVSSLLIRAVDDENSYDDDPSVVEDLLNDADAVKEGKEKELESIRKYGVYEEVDEAVVKKRKGRIIGTRWVLVPKPGRVKARLVAKDFKTENTSEFFAPTPNLASLRTLISHCSWSRQLYSKSRFALKVVDIGTAFLNAEVGDREVFIRPPADVRSPGVLWRLKRALYGLRAAPQLWSDFLSERLSELGFDRCDDDASFYTRDRDDPSKQVVLLVHVDDIIMSGPQAAIDDVVERLEKMFTLTKGVTLLRDGDSCTMLGRKIVRTSSGFTCFY